jgi:hypothetical protein
VLAGACLLTLGGAAAAEASPATPAAATGPPAVTPITSAAVAPKPPKGYTVVESITVAPTGAHTRGEVAWPAGTVPFAGGVSISSPSLLANVARLVPRRPHLDRRCEQRKRRRREP